MAELTDLETLAHGVLAGKRLALARALRLVDDRPVLAHDLVRRLAPASGKAHIIGVTGTPGAGKSTLVDYLIRHFRGRGERVAVLAVDPSSPFSGGAILGDRVRMTVHAGDDGVFIRSLATRGMLGGLSASTYHSLVALDAAGYRRIIVETVGVGQDEVDIARTAHTTLVLLVPGAGDEIQSIKAGLLEIADLFVLNKADRPGAEQAASDIKILLAMLPADHAGWRPRLLRTVALYGDGIAELGGAIEEHRRFLSDDPTGRARLAANQRAVFESIVHSRLIGQGLERIGAPRLERALVAAGERGADLFALADQLLA